MIYRIHSLELITMQHALITEVITIDDTDAAQRG